MAQRSRAGLADMPPGVITAILTAARSDEATIAAALTATCRVLRHTVLLCCVSKATLQRFGRSQQIAPLMQRLTGAEDHHACFGWSRFP